jgi:Fuc2NAc and GlcNAc transferase
MTAATALVGTAALILAALLTGVARRLAARGRFLDVPNDRSSHTEVTPRGGGAAIVLVVSAATIALAAHGTLPRGLCPAALGGILVAAVGFLDDRRALTPAVRLAVHAAAAVWAVVWLGGLPPLRFGAQAVDLGWAGHALAVLGIVWVLNLFNFMDGIDGLAASEAVFLAIGGALILSSARVDGVAGLAIVFGSACAGFLLWNWPPARIFMGDVGSGYLGYLIAVLALASARDDPAAMWIWLILGGVFFVDATVTLVRRALRGDPVHEAHRSHAYQWLARRWRSHQRVTLTVAGVNLGWLVPCALLAQRNPDYAAALVPIAFAPLVLLAFVGGAGRAE